MKQGPSIRHFVLWALVITLTACRGTPVAHDLNQQQANEIVAALNQNGIAARANRETGGRGRFNVEVSKTFYSQAVVLLHEKNLPGEVKPVLTDLIGQQGLLPASRESEALRLDHALALELDESLVRLPGIEQVKSVVRSNFARRGEAPAVSLVIQTRPGARINGDDIAALVTKMVPGIKIENIVMAIHPKETVDGARAAVGAINAAGEVRYVPLIPFLRQWHIAAGDYTGLAYALVACIMLALLAGGFIGYWYCLFQRLRALARRPELPLTRPASGRGESRALPAERNRKHLTESRE